jgi:hypothetical protein
MLKYWYDSPHTIGKKKQKMVKYCCFIWTQEPILKPLVFWPEFGSDEDFVCQLLIESVNDKSSVTQEDIECALCWRQSCSPVSTLRKKKRQKEKPKLLLTGIYSPPHNNPAVPPVQAPEPPPGHHPRLAPIHLLLLTLPPPLPFNSLTPPLLT